MDIKSLSGEYLLISVCYNTSFAFAIYTNLNGVRIQSMTAWRFTALLSLTPFHCLDKRDNFDFEVVYFSMLTVLSQSLV